MRKDYYKRLLIVMLAITLLLAVNSIFSIISVKGMVVFLFIIFIGMVFILKWEKSRVSNSRVVFIVIVMSICYKLMTYIAGLFIGFLSNVYSLTLPNILMNALPIVMIILFTELIRYILSIKSSRKKGYLVLVIILTTLINITYITRSFDFGNPNDVIKFLFVYAVPFLVNNTYLTYQVLKLGIRVNIIYRFIFELPLFLLPLSPDLGYYMTGVFGILVPLFFMFIVHRLTSGEQIRKVQNNKIARNISLVTMTLVGLTVIGLFSGWFRYHILIVATGSMNPKINIGDAIIVDKLNSDEINELELGDVLVFKKMDMIVVHRIVEIETIDGVLTFTTKGDANKSVDSFKTTKKDVIGITNVKIPYIGTPGVWLHDQIAKTKK